MTEEEMCDLRAPTPESMKALTGYYNMLKKENDGMAKTAYTLALLTEAAMNFFAFKLKALRSHKEVADVIFLRNRRDFRHGYTLVNHADLLDPVRVERAPILQVMLQYPTPQITAMFQAAIDGKNVNVPAEVQAHWERHAKPPIPPTPAPVIDAAALQPMSTGTMQ